jgi:hypothetical protein
MRLLAPLVPLMASAALLVKGAPTPGSQPNIVLVLVDDQDATLNST